VLEQKLDSGHWDISSSQLKQYAADVTGEVRFTAYKPAPLLRSCGVAKGSCAGEPVEVNFSLRSHTPPAGTAGI
jgi:hypothetical protein